MDLLVRNTGATDEEATVALLAPAGEIEPPKQVIRLSPSETQRVTFWWDTTGVAPGDWELVGRIAESHSNLAAISDTDGHIRIRVTD